MNEREAKDMLQAKLICLELDSNIEGCDGDCKECEYNYTQGTLGEQKEALKMAIKALEKQIPKKVNKETKDSYDNVIPRCPSCLKMFVEDYCSKCGQKIDWTVEE